MDGLVKHSLARHDAIHILEASLPSHHSPRVLGTDSPSPVGLSDLRAPVNLRFFSDNSLEGSGFSISWEYTRPAPPPSSTGPSGSAGGEAENWNNTFPLSDLKWIIPTVAVSIAVLVICLLCDCARRYRRRSGGESLPTSRVGTNSRYASTPPTGPRAGANAAEDASPKPAQANQQQFRVGARMFGRGASRSKVGKPEAESNNKKSTNRPAPALPESLGLEGQPSIAACQIASVRTEMLSKVGDSEAEKRLVLRDLQRRWHPDKNRDEDKKVCTAVFQYITSNSQWFLAGNAGN